MIYIGVLLCISEEKKTIISTLRRSISDAEIPLHARSNVYLFCRRVYFTGSKRCWIMRYHQLELTTTKAR